MSRPEDLQILQLWLFESPQGLPWSHLYPWPQGPGCGFVCGLISPPETSLVDALRSLLLSLSLSLSFSISPGVPHLPGCLCPTRPTLLPVSRYTQKLRHQLGRDSKFILCYSQKEEVLLDFLSLAHKYGFPELEDSTSEYLCTILNIQNVCMTFDVASLYSLPKLTCMCCMFMDRNAQEVLSSEGFLSLSKVGHCLQGIYRHTLFHLYLNSRNAAMD